MKTKRMVVVLLAMVAAVFVSAHAQAVVQFDVGVTVGATATVAKNVSLSVSPANIVFGATTADAFATTPTDRITITYASNYNPWKIRIWTNNTQVQDVVFDNGVTTGRYSKGGLATTLADPKTNLVVPCKWFAKRPGSATTVFAPTTTFVQKWNFVKDKRDRDDPTTTDDFSTPDVVENQDESWEAAANDPRGYNYVNIAYRTITDLYGGAANSGVCVDAANIPTYKGDEINGQVAVYIAGLFGSSGGVPGNPKNPPSPAAPGSYSTVFGFDLYHE